MRLLVDGPEMGLKWSWDDENSVVLGILVVVCFNSIDLECIGSPCAVID